MNQSSATTTVPGHGSRVPDTFVILFCIVVAAALMSFLVPQGAFQTEVITYEQQGSERTREVVVPGSFEYLKDEDGQPLRRGVALFSADSDRAGLLNFAFEGLVAGDRHTAAVGVIAFILLIGGAFGIILQTGAIQTGLVKVVHVMKGRDVLLIPVITVLFSLGGAIFGMGAESIALAMIIIPLIVVLGYDVLTAILITYVATQVGFGSSWMNPFSVGVAQGIAGVPVLSGAGFRIVLWTIFTLVLVLFALWYAIRVKRRPELSPVPEANAWFRDRFEEQVASRFSVGHALVIAILCAGIAWIVWGVTFRGYYIAEIATQFFAMGLAAGVVAILSRLNGMDANAVAASFKEGAAALLPAALIVAMAQGILVVLGGNDPASPSVLNTILHAMSRAMEGQGSIASALSMLGFQAGFNFFVSSGTGQAALTMPIMAPLADLVGVSRQVAVLAFQLGDGVTNLIIPTSAVLMGVLGVARVSWWTWVRFIIPFVLLLLGLSMVFVTVAVMIGFS
jgi:uncharacterized ion transporter superfamily protein YfcC